MPSQNGNRGRGGPWGSGAKPGSDIEDLVRHGQAVDLVNDDDIDFCAP